MPTNAETYTQAYTRSYLTYYQELLETAHSEMVGKYNSEMAYRETLGDRITELDGTIENYFKAVDAGMDSRSSREDQAWSRLLRAAQIDATSSSANAERRLRAVGTADTIFNGRLRGVRGAIMSEQNVLRSQIEQTQLDPQGDTAGAVRIILGDSESLAREMAGLEDAQRVGGALELYQVLNNAGLTEDEARGLAAETFGLQSAQVDVGLYNADRDDYAERLQREGAASSGNIREYREHLERAAYAAVGIDGAEEVSSSIAEMDTLFERRMGELDNLQARRQGLVDELAEPAPLAPTREDAEARARQLTAPVRRSGLSLRESHQQRIRQREMEARSRAISDMPADQRVLLSAFSKGFGLADRNGTLDSSQDIQDMAEELRGAMGGRQLGGSNRGARLVELATELSRRHLGENLTSDSLRQTRDSLLTALAYRSRGIDIEERPAAEGQPLARSAQPINEETGLHEPTEDDLFEQRLEANVIPPQQPYESGGTGHFDRLENPSNFPWLVQE